MRLPTAWREGWWWWLLPIVVLCGNVAFYAYNHAAATSGFAQIQSAEEREHRALEALRGERATLREALAIARSNREGLEELYERRLARQDERLTEVITEVKALARRVSLEPPRIAYAEERIEDFDLVRKSLVFRVRGSYREIRELVNLLEVSDSFLILEEIRLREGEGDTLSIDLVIATLFATEPASPPSADEAETSS